MKLKYTLLAISFLVVSCTGPEARQHSTESSFEARAATSPVTSVRTPVQIFGRVTTGDEQTLTAEFPARVVNVHLHAGARAVGGDALITLDLSELEREQNSLADRYRRIELQIDDLQARMRTVTDVEHPEQTEASLNIEAAEDEVRRARINLDRTGQLFSESAVSQRVLDDARESFAAAERALQRARLSARATTERLSRTARELEREIELSLLDRDRIREERSDLARRIDHSGLSDSSIVSPFRNGLVTEIFVIPGDRVSPGARLARVADRASLEVIADLPEEFLLDVQTGDRAEIVPLADRNRRYRGQIEWIASLAQRSGNETTVRTRILLEETDDFILPGMNVDVTITPAD